jgi:hypothetical protein
MATINSVLSAPALGAGLHEKFQDFNFANLRGVGRAYPGMVFSFQGELFQVVQNRNGGAITVGQVVSLSIASSGRIGNLTADSTKAIVETDDTLDSGLSGGKEYPGKLITTTGATATTEDEEIRNILANSTATGASTITVAEYDRSMGPNEGVATSSADAYDTLLDASADYSVFCPWEVVLADIDALLTAIPQGVVVSTSITDDYFGIIQLSGVAMTEVDGTTDLAAGDQLIPSSTAGAAAKWVVTTTDPTTVQIENANKVLGRVLDAYTADAVGRRAVLLTHRPLIPYHFV